MPPWRLVEFAVGEERPPPALNRCDPAPRVDGAARAPRRDEDDAGLISPPVRLLSSSISPHSAARHPYGFCYPILTWHRGVSNCLQTAPSIEVDERLTPFSYSGNWQRPPQSQPRHEGTNSQLDRLRPTLSFVCSFLPRGFLFLR